MKGLSYVFKIFPVSSLVFVLMLSFAATGLTVIRSDANEEELYNYLVYTLNCPPVCEEFSTFDASTTESITHYLSDLGVIPQCLFPSILGGISPRDLVWVINKNEKCIKDFCEEEKRQRDFIKFLTVSN
jgi:hypothetical protein